MAENKKELTITEEVRELVYDIQNKTYLTGQARETEGKSYQSVSNMQISDDEEDGYQIRRSLANAFSELKSILSEYLYEDRTTGNNRVQNEIDNNGKLTLVFKLPLNYNNTSADSLGNGIHSYLVEMTLADWFSITNKEDSEIYAKRSVVNLENVKRALYRRHRPKRPTY